MLKVYGSMLCGDCVECREAFTRNGVEFIYLDFAEDLKNLKEFLELRDRVPQFEQVKAEGKIGIPCIVTDSGEVSLDWQLFLPTM